MSIVIKNTVVLTREKAESKFKEFYLEKAVHKIVKRVERKLEDMDDRELEQKLERLADKRSARLNGGEREDIFVVKD